MSTDTSTAKSTDKAKSQTDYLATGSFAWEDPFLLNDQLTEDESMEIGRASCRERV